METVEIHPYTEYFNADSHLFGESGYHLGSNGYFGDSTDSESSNHGRLEPRESFTNIVRSITNLVWFIWFIFDKT